MLRSVGALTFGAFADQYGAKWPMIVAMLLFVVLELASGFCQTLPQFLAVRSLYGIAMGGKSHASSVQAITEPLGRRNVWPRSKYSSGRFAI